MEKEKLALRMYFFVPYNISPIQQAIQAGHAALEYVRRYGKDVPDHLLWEFINDHKTWIILNGGTTNFHLGPDDKPKGTLNQIHEDLWTNKIDHSIFFEPDLNDALTAICFLADEKVWDYEKYPEFEDYGYDTLSYNYPVNYQNWVKDMGKQRLFLRELLKGKKLA